jgi:hypothetical protein
MASANPKQEDHPQAPGLASMAFFAVFLAVVLTSLAIFLHFKFGTPVP